MRASRPGSLFTLLAWLAQSIYAPLHVLTETHYWTFASGASPLAAAHSGHDHGHHHGHHHDHHLGEGNHHGSHEPHPAEDHLLTGITFRSSPAPVLSPTVLAQSFPGVQLEPELQGFAAPAPIHQPRAPPFLTPRQPRAPPSA